MGVIADLVLKLRHVLGDGVATPDRSTINFIGGSVVDNPVEGRIDVTIGSGVATLGVTTPILNTGTATDPVIAISAATTSALGSMKCAGDLAGTGSTGSIPRTSGINSTTVGAGGALTTGQVLRATGASAAAWGTVDLANVAAVSGILDADNVDATSTPTASAIAKWGASVEMGAAQFYDSSAGTLPNTGLLRTHDGPTVLIGGHAAAGTANRRLLAWDAGDLRLGVDATTVDVDGAASAGFGAGGTRVAWATSDGLQLFSGGSEDFAGGVGVLGITDATTEPTTVPGAGNVVAWALRGQVKAVGPKGLVTSMSTDTSGVQTLSIADRLWWTVDTTDATATVAGTYELAVPEGGQFMAEVWVTGVADGTDTRVFFKVLAGGGRPPAGSTVVDFTSGTTALFDSITVAGPPTVTISANAVRLNARGKAATNISWTFEGTIRIWKA